MSSEKLAVNVHENSLVKALKQMADEEPFVQLQGYAIRDAVHHRIKLYQDLSLESYFEINDADILHTIDGDGETAPGTVFVKSKAHVALTTKAMVTAETLKPQPVPWNGEAAGALGSVEADALGQTNAAQPRIGSVPFINVPNRVALGYCHWVNRLEWHNGRYYAYKYFVCDPMG